MSGPFAETVFASNKPVRVGAGRDTGDVAFNGCIDQLRIVLVGVASQQTEVVNYRYNDANQLVSASGALVGSYEYDARGTDTQVSSA